MKKNSGFGTLLVFILIAAAAGWLLKHKGAAFIIIAAIAALALLLAMAKSAKRKKEVEAQRRAAALAEKEEAERQRVRDLEAANRPAIVNPADDEQYTYEGILKRGHYSLVPYASKSQKAQEWMSDLIVGEEILVDLDIEKGKYMMDDTVAAPERVVGIYEHKEITRFYVHEINIDDNGNYSIVIICAYNVREFS